VAVSELLYAIDGDNDNEADLERDVEVIFAERDHDEDGKWSEEEYFIAVGEKIYALALQDALTNPTRWKAEVESQATSP